MSTYLISDKFKELVAKNISKNTAYSKKYILQLINDFDSIDVVLNGIVVADTQYMGLRQACELI